MKLSQIDSTNLTDKQINLIVFSDIDDSNENADLAIVFGNSDMIKERTLKSVEMYEKGRVKKILFTGGTGGITNTSGDTISEALKMKRLAISKGIKEENIIIEESNNSFENVLNSLSLIDLSVVKSIMIITSDFHLKRCMAIMKNHIGDKVKYVLVPVKNGYSDEENWFNSEKAWGTGRGIVTFEAEILIRYAKEGKIFDLDINNYQIKTH